MTSQQASGIAATDSDDLVDTLVQSAFATMAVLTRIAAEHDLSLTQLRVLAILRDRRPRMTALADYLGLEKSTMSGLVDRAERRGLLERVPGAGDGRAVDVQLSGDCRICSGACSRRGVLSPLRDRPLSGGEGNSRAGQSQRASLMRTRLPAGSRRAQSRTPYGWSAGSWTTSAPLACSCANMPSRSSVARVMRA
jgi:hypothetical protein